ncbi:MAG: tyrosine-type recombinase/integrase [Bacteroidetes bacterium]|nr:tyrosine-type recombinase/integrase [Bacteroidota bacterium]
MYRALVDSFIDYIQLQKRYSKHTITAYSNDLAQFFSYLQTQYDIAEPKEVKPAFIKSWVYELTNDKAAPRTINRKVVALKSFYKFLLVNGKIAKSPVTTIKSLKTDSRLVEWVPEKPMNILLEDTDWGVDFSGIRDRVMLELLYATGIRLNELITLHSSKVDLASGVIKVLGKGDKERIIPIHNKLVEVARFYLLAKEESGWAKTAPFLVTDKGEQLYPVFVYRKVKQFLGKVSSAKKISPHVLRHTFATHLLNKGADINAIKELLGHSSLAATQVYTHNSIEKLKEIYKQAHPKS